MNEYVENLVNLLNIKDKLTQKHDISASLLPFFTRNPERVQFENGFSPIVGVIARRLSGENAELAKDSLEIDPTMLDSSINDEKIYELFNKDNYQRLHSAKLLQYQPLTANRQSKGEIRLGSFLIQLLHLDTNQEFLQIFKDDQPDNLYEKVLYESLSGTAGNSKEKDITFTFYDHNWFSNLFMNDVSNFLKNKDYFYKHIADLLKFYYFTYTIQLISRISDAKNEELIQPLYFTLEDESISQARLPVQQGYQLVYQHGQDLLVDMDVLNYLNALIPDKHFYWKPEILAPDFLYRSELLVNLKQFLQVYQLYGDSEILDSMGQRATNLTDLVETLRLLLETKKDATNSRYSKSLEEILKQGYFRQHGRIGRVLSLNNETLLMLTAAIVGNRKMLLNDVFDALQMRGIYFDRLTREQIVQLFERVNILEKLSDSGDAQYVKGIL